jgi:hypothetical protein
LDRGGDGVDGGGVDGGTPVGAVGIKAVWIQVEVGEEAIIVAAEKWQRTMAEGVAL